MSFCPEKSDVAEILANFWFLEADFDKDLKQVIDRWPSLGVELRQAILKMIG